MKFSRDTVFLLIFFVLLLLGMVLTLLFGGEKSRHGYGSIPDAPGNTLSAVVHAEKNSPIIGR